jgi:signal peptidase II
MAEAAEIVYVPVKDRLNANRKLGYTLAAGVLILDQAVKWIVTYIFQLEERRSIDLMPFFRLYWTENRGVSMGYLTTGSEVERWLLVALTAAIAGFVGAWLWREKQREDVLALGLVLGGAFGNILDRVRLGYVVDYADLHFGNVHPFLVFNVGDAAITIGVLLLVLRALLTRDKTPPQKDE